MPNNGLVSCHKTEDPDFDEFVIMTIYCEKCKSFNVAVLFVAQLVEWSLQTPEIYGLSSVSGILKIELKRRK